MEKKLQTGWLTWSYSWRSLRRDLVAGLTVGAVAVPQGMAYALIAGVRPEYGLYTAIVTTFFGSLFGSSALLINGPTNAISLAVFSAVAGLAQGPDDPLRIQTVSLLALLVGAIQILIALLKLGDLTRYISESVVLGFMAGAALLVALSQIPNLVGLPQQGTGDQHFLYRLWLTLSRGGGINPYDLGIGLATALLVVGLRRLGYRLGLAIPDLLISLLLASVVVWACDWGPRGGRPAVLEVVGYVPATLPTFHWPEVRTPWLRSLSGSALAVALLSLLEALAISKAIAVRTRVPLDFNKQCLAEGLANLGGGLFQCMPGSGSLTRSAINFQAGAATRMAGMLSAASVAAALLLLAPTAYYVPKAALAGLLVVTAWRLVDKQRLRYCFRATRFDAQIALATAASAVFVSIEFSILIGTFLSFLFFVPRAARLQAHELVVGPGRVLRERQPDDPQCTQLALFSLEGEMFFGAGPELNDHLEELERRTEAGTRIVVLRLKRARNPDMVCLERLEHFVKDMHARGVTVLFCGVRPDFAQALANVRLHHWLPTECLYLEEATAGSATLHAVRRAYELLGQDRCPTCPRRDEPDEGQGDWYYMI
jgi:SulP family sulfate permease